MDDLCKLKNVWRESLSQKYGPDDGESEGNVEHCVGILAKIFTEFVDSGCADTKFTSQMINGIGKQHEQALSEMLFYDVLKRDGFELLPVGDKGPDFKVVKSNIHCFCEVITPEPDKEGVIEHYNNHIDTRVVAGARRTFKQDEEIFLKITSALKAKQNKFKEYKKNKVIPEDALCVIVINDALFCPADLPMFGVSHSANWGEDSYISRATLSNSDGLKTKNFSPIPLNGFLNDSLDHVSAVIQVTLRDDYALRIKHVNELNIEFCRLAQFINNYDIVLNPKATNKIPVDFFNMDHWLLDEKNKVFVKKVAINPTIRDLARYHNLILKNFGLPEKDESELILALSSKSS